MSKTLTGVEALNRFAADVIQQAGEMALTYYGKGQLQYKFDSSLITEAELNLNDFFEQQLRARFPQHQLYRGNNLATDYTHDDTRYLWIFDPLDGAANLQAGIPIWGLSLSLLENFWPLCGFIYMPATGDLFHARAGEQAYRGDTPFKIEGRDDIDDEGLLFTYSRFHQQFRSTFPGKIRNLGCTVAHVCYVAMGRADAAIVAKESYQDLAAARIILEAAGGRFCKLNGQDFFLNSHLDGDRIDEPLIAVSPQLRRRIVEFIQPVD